MTPAEPAVTRLPPQQVALDQPERLAAVRRVIAAGSARSRLDRLVDLAARLVDAPYAQVSLIGTDQQVVASTHGLPDLSPPWQEPAAGSLCTVAVRSGATLAVDDAPADPRVRHLPPVTSGMLGSYLGALLADNDGNVLGSLCVYGPQPRTWTAEQVRLLDEVAALVNAELTEHVASLPGDLGLRASLAADAAGLGTFAYNLADAGRIDWDDRMRELHGLAPGSFDGTLTEFEAVVHPQDLPAVQSALEQARTSIGELNAEYRVVTDTATRWLRVRGRVVPDMLGEPSHVIGAAYDATTERDLRDELYRLMETLPAALVRLDREWAITYVNVTAEHILGAGRQELLGRDVRAVVTSLPDSTFGRAYAEAMRTGEPATVVDYFAELDTTFEVHIWPDEQGLTIFTQDVSARARAQAELEQARDRFAVLATAGAQLSGSLPPQEVLVRLGDLVVPALGCSATVAVTEQVAEMLGLGVGRELDRLHVVYVQHVDPAVQAELQAVLDELDLRTDGVTGLGRVVRTGRAELFDRIPDELLQARASSAEQLERMRKLNTGAQLTVPLTAAGTVLGAATVAGSPGQVLDEPLLLDLAGRAAIALQHALTFARQHQAATVLQRALLPQHVAQLPGVLVASRYLPAAEQALAGGDFFRTLTVEGKLVCVLGDVMGHGTASAARAGQLHGLVATLALQGMEPGKLLTTLSAGIGQLMDLSLATVLVCVYDPDTRQLTMATAGHPPPLVAPLDGEPFYVQLDPGPPLGVAAGLYDQVSVGLPQGCTVVLYSDGLVEQRQDDSIADGLERLRQAVFELSLPPEAVADHVLERLGMLDGSDDDIALLVLAHP